jgi:5,10-methylenetetrahydromethanopterin reductase
MVNTAELGVGLFGTEPVDRMVELTRLAEELGFASAWIGDSQNLWRDAYVTLGAAATATSRIGLGTGVTNSVTRHVSVLASAWTSLAELAPGRVHFAIGTGDSSLRSMGMTPQRVAELGDGIARLRALLAGEEVKDPTSGGSYRLGFAGSPRIPLYVAAASPRALRLAGRAADGVVACVGVDRRLVEAALRHVREGAESCGRDPTEI